MSPAWGARRGMHTSCCRGFELAPGPQNHHCETRFSINELQRSSFPSMCFVAASQGAPSPALWKLVQATPRWFASPGEFSAWIRNPCSSLKSRGGISPQSSGGEGGLKSREKITLERLAVGGSEGRRRPVGVCAGA